MDEVDLTEDKEEEERKKTNPEEEGAQVETTTTNQQNDGDISEDEREDVESLVRGPRPTGRAGIVGLRGRI